MRIAYYFEPGSGDRPGIKAPGRIFRIVKELDVLELERKTEPLWELIRENQARFGIKPLAIISADTQAMFDYLLKKYEEGLLARLTARNMGTKSAQQWAIEDISDRRTGWGLGW